MSATKRPFITIEGVKISFNIETGKIEFHLPIAFTGKKLQSWKEKNAAEILEAIKELGATIVKSKPGKKAKTKTADTNTGNFGINIHKGGNKILPKQKPIYAKKS
jgi:hypothetical protein